MGLTMLHPWRSQTLGSRGYRCGYCQRRQMSSFWIRTWWFLKGLVEGRKVYANMTKYHIKMTVSSQLRNIFSLLFASIFLPSFQWLPFIWLYQSHLIFPVSPFLLTMSAKGFLKKPRIWKQTPSCALWPGLVPIHQYLILLPTCFFISLLSPMTFWVMALTMEQQMQRALSWCSKLDGLLNLCGLKPWYSYVTFTKTSIWPKSSSLLGRGDASSSNLLCNLPSIWSFGFYLEVEPTKWIVLCSIVCWLSSSICWVRLSNVSINTKNSL